MKNYFGFLSTFKPDQSVLVLLDAINKFWPGNAVKIKKNFWMLLPVFWKIILWIFMFIGLLILAFYQYYDKWFVKTFSVIVILYVFLTFFWLIFSFLRILKNKQEEKVYYTAVTTDMVINLKDFKTYVNNTLLVMLLQWILALVNIAMVIKLSGNLMEYAITFWQLVINVYFIILMYQVLKKIIDSEMDFVVATPVTMTFFSQTGFFQTNTNVVNNTQIKTFNETTVGFFPSVLWYGTILIRTEGDDFSVLEIDNHDTNRLKLRFVNSPKKVIDKLESIIRSGVKEDRTKHKQYVLEDFIETDKVSNIFSKTIFSILMPWFILNRLLPKIKVSTNDWIKNDLNEKLNTVKELNQKNTQVAEKLIDEKLANMEVVNDLISYNAEKISITQDQYTFLIDKINHSIELVNEASKNIKEVQESIKK